MSDTDEPGKKCSKCGRDDGHHSWVDDDCTLPHHKNHSRATAGLACGWCIDRHKDWLREIVELYAGLATVIALGSVDEGTIEYQKPRKKPASPAMMRLDAWVMQCDHARLYAAGEKQRDGTFTTNYLAGLPDIPAVMADWAAYVTDGLGWTNTAPNTVTGAAAFLTAQATEIGHMPLIDDYDAEIGWVRRSLRRAHGITDPQALGECLTVKEARNCGGHVYPVPGERPKCDRCGRRYDTHDLVRLKLNEKNKKERREPRPA